MQQGYLLLCPRQNFQKFMVTDTVKLCMFLYDGEPTACFALDCL